MSYPDAVWERAMTVQQVMLKALSGEMHWFRAADILGWSPRTLRRWRKRYETHGYVGLVDKRRHSPSVRRIAAPEVERLHLESLGHEVVVADPNCLPMYGRRSRRVKTDQRDVATLTEACQRGIYRVVHRRSARQQGVQSQLNVRQGLVQARTRAISLARAITRAAGLRLRSGRIETFLTRLDALDLPASMKATLLPLRSVIEVLDDELASADDQFSAMVSADAVVKRLTTLPSIGPITASAYVAALDDVSRFSGAGQVTSYLGLVPREYSSGEQQRRGRILRSAHPHVQSLLVQAAWRMSRSSSPDTATLRTWAQAIARRRGKKVAMVALARRLARILFAMWRDEVEYQPDFEDNRRSPRRSARIAKPPLSSRSVTGEVVKLEEQARVWRLAASESRPTESAAPPSDLIVRRHM